SGAFDKILPIRECHLMEDINNRLRNGTQQYAYEHDLTFFNAREHRGLLRNMMVRLSNTGELMVVMQFCFAPFGTLSAEQLRNQALEMLQWMHETFPEMSSLLWVNNEKFNDTIGDLDIQLYSGTDHIFLEMENLRFKVGPKSFYQTNTEQAYILYKVARDFAGLTGNELVYDLYTGTGTIANFVAGAARKVIGIEYVPEAIEDAKINSQINGIANTEFFAGDMKDILNRDFIEVHGKPDVIITDPPRAGMHQDVIDTILFADPQRIVYVSCNPATQARDLQLLNDRYEVKRIQPVDMFPHTQHVENVVLLEKR
ncbi:MAG: 23S rRNA (uracil(1939)-C(5))-methyltransferase RlmD, partial [Bacteroidaceae bacterium]|nr:23S rRNA (uracil(1939)-C(5))-methyltransferase RlmD [Bacteroidaceae bacterium]